MKNIPFGVILAVVATYLVGIPFGWSILIAAIIEGSICFVKKIKTPDEQDKVKMLNIDSQEYLSRFMPKN